MKKYKVTLREDASYEVIVKALNEDDAAEKAEEMFVKKGCTAFPCEVHDRGADNVEEMKD